MTSTCFTYTHSHHTHHFNHTFLCRLDHHTSQLHEHGDWHGAIDDLVAANEQASNVELFGQGYGPRKLLHR